MSGDDFMVHTLRFSDEEEKKYNELYGESNLNFSTIVKKKLFQTHTESNRQSDIFMRNLGNLATHINMLETHISDKNTEAFRLLNSIKKEVADIWQSL